jgi:hypothetical protein
MAYSSPTIAIGWLDGNFMACLLAENQIFTGLACINAATRALAMSLRPGQRFCAVLSETGSVHLNVVAEEVSRVADLSSEDFN